MVVETIYETVRVFQTNNNCEINLISLANPGWGVWGPSINHAQSALKGQYYMFFYKGPFKCYVTQMGVGGVTFSGKKCYEGVRYNVISITRGWVGVQFPREKRYVTLEWPLTV